MAIYFWLLIATLSFAGDYFVTYRGVYYSGSLQTESVWIVPSISTDNTTSKYHICFLPHTSLTSLTHAEKTSLVAQLTQQGFFVSDTLTSINENSKARTVLTFPPTKMRINFDMQCEQK